MSDQRGERRRSARVGPIATIFRRSSAVALSVVLAMAVFGACGSSGSHGSSDRHQESGSSGSSRATSTASSKKQSGSRSSGSGTSATSPGSSANSGSVGAPVDGATPGRTSGAAGSSNDGGGGSAPSGGAALPSAQADASLIGVARASVEDVLLLHNLATGLGRDNGLPGDVTVSESDRITDRFRAGARAATARSSKDRWAAPLAGVLGDYATLAQKLHSAATSADKKLPATFSGDLAAIDTRWKATLGRIGQASGTDLLAKLPPLLMPQQSAQTVPPPPK